MNTIGGPPQRSPVDAEDGLCGEDERDYIEKNDFDVSSSALNEDWITVPEYVSHRSGLWYSGIFNSWVGRHREGAAALQPDCSKTCTEGEPGRGELHIGTRRSISVGRIPRCYSLFTKQAPTYQLSRRRAQILVHSKFHA
jgi:hypothetical protein